MVLLDNSAHSVYMAQTGVVGAPAGQSYPTHLTPFKLVSTDTTMTGDTLKIVFEAQSDGVKVVKTYNLQKGSTAMGVQHDVYNVDRASDTTSLYITLSHASPTHSNKTLLTT